MWLHSEAWMPPLRSLASRGSLSGKVLAIIFLLAPHVAGQNGSAQSGSSVPAQLPSAPGTPDQAPVPTLKVSTRMVSLEVVARDHDGHPVRGLTAKDFQITEQVAPR